MQEIKATQRTELGKKVSALRRAGFLPAVVYGEGEKTQAISVSQRDFEKAHHEAGESTLLSLDVEGRKYNVLIHDIVHDPIRGTPLHADFYAVRMDKVLQTKVPLELVGESPAVKNEGGILIRVMQEIEIEALPKDLPHKLKAEAGMLNKLEARLLVRDIKIPKGVKILAEPDKVVAIVESPRSAEEIAALTETSVAEVEPVETEREAEQKKAAVIAAEAEEKEEK